MLHDHFSAEELELFLKDPKNFSLKTKVLRHLVAGCPVCRLRLDEHGWDGCRLERLLDFPELEAEESLETGPVLPAPYNYDHVFAKLEKTLDAFFTENGPVEEPPPELLAELFPLQEASVSSQLSSKSELIPQLVKWLVEGSHRLRYRNLERMLEWAHFACLASEACPVQIAGGESRLADLRGQAWRQLGNSLRVCGRISEAGEAMAKAQTYLGKGTGDPSLRARLMEQMASLYIFERKFEEAVKVTDEAVCIYEDLEDPHGWAGVMIQRAIARLYQGLPEDGIRDLKAAIPVIDSEHDPHLALAAYHNLVICHIECGNAQEALSLYHEIEGFKKSFDDPLILLRISWQEGRLLRELGHLKQAEAVLAKARRGFIERGLAYDVAMISFDLASVYRKLGRLEETREIVSDTVPIFRALRIGREMLAAFIQLKKAAKQEPEDSG